MKYFTIVFLVILSFFAAMPSFASGIGGMSFRALANAELKTAQAAFSGQTVIMKRLSDPTGYQKGAKSIPIKGTFVAYLASNGQILIWSKESSKVINGAWAVVSSKEKKPKILFCISLTKQRKNVMCTIVKYLAKAIFDDVKGNVFNLKAGASVPAPLPYSKRISTIQDKIK